jgi:pyruvate/2-oxoglutarate dehydrogenase complex dihydrolipoamide dehydrogenase (E3) component
VKNVKILEGEAVSIGSTKVELKDGTVLVEFDFLVIAIGCRYDLSLLNISQDEETLKVISGTSVDNMLKYATDIENAKKIAVIGTGPIGIEILGSLLVEFLNLTFGLV